ncbi:MAG: hypothetical protein ABEN55_03765 [Bradymonadaceae bacterium]
MKMLESFERESNELESYPIYWLEHRIIELQKTDHSLNIDRFPGFERCLEKLPEAAHDLLKAANQGDIDDYDRILDYLLLLRAEVKSINLDTPDMARSYRRRRQELT